MYDEPSRLEPKQETSAQMTETSKECNLKKLQTVNRYRETVRIKKQFEPWPV